MAWSDRQSSQPPKRQVSLRVRKGPLRGQFFPTSDAHALLIGSAASNHIVLPHEQVSATHCLLARRRSGKSFALIDARSRHGTEVNGRRLAKGTVTLGDVIAIGPFELELVETLSAQRPPYAVRPSAGRPARIELLSPGDEVEVLRPASATILGRGRLAHVAVDDSFVSTFHCLITLHPDDDDRQPFVIDLYSENGTFVNGRSVHRKHMRLSDTLAVGQAEFILRLHEAGWQAAEPEPEAAPLEGAPRPASRIVLAARPSRPAAREPVVLPMLEAPAAKARAAEAADAGPTLAASTPPPPVPPAGVVTEPAAAPPDRASERTGRPTA